MITWTCILKSGVAIADLFYSTWFLNYEVKVAGGCPRSIFTSLLFLIEGNSSYQTLFTELKNIALSLNIS